ncbi:MAG: T9SS type A sorting domain-containing protein [bacterium]
MRLIPIVAATRSLPLLLILLYVLLPEATRSQSRFETAATSGLVSVPLKWVGIAGSPSIDDPSLVGERSVKDLLWRRHERASDRILIPQCNVTLRSAAFRDITNFPVITDPDLTIGNPGDISLGSREAIRDRRPDLTEYLAAIDLARQSWTNLKNSVGNRLSFAREFGIVAVNINRFIDDEGNPVDDYLGIGGFNDLRCDDGVQVNIGRVMVIDAAYMLPGSPLNLPDLADDPHETILAHEVLHALALDHVNRDLCAPVDADEWEHNLMFPAYPVEQNLTVEQCDCIREQALNHVPGTEHFPPGSLMAAGGGAPRQKGPFADMRSDARKDVAAEEENDIIDIGVGGMVIDIAQVAREPHFFLTTAGLIADTREADLCFTFLLDADNDPRTGGAPELMNVPTDAKGIEMVGRVFLKKFIYSDSPHLSADCFVFNTQSERFEPRDESLLTPTLVSDSVYIFTSDTSFRSPVGEIIQLGVHDNRTEILPIVRYLAIAENFRTGEIDRTNSFRLSFRTPGFPTGSVQPERIPNAGTVEITAEGLPPTEAAHVFLGPDPIADDSTDGQGNFRLTTVIEIPGLQQTVARLVTVGTENTALTADMTVTVDPAAPSFMFGVDGDNDFLVRVNVKDTNPLAVNWGTVTDGSASIVDLEAMTWDPGSRRLLLISNEDDGPLYAIDGSVLGGPMPLAARNLAAAFIGSTGSDDIEDIAVNPVTGELFGVDNSSHQLLLIDRTTAAVTEIGALGFRDVEAITFRVEADSTVVLYGADTKTGKLLVIDLATGAGTPVHPTNTIGFPQVEGLAFSPQNTLFGFSNGEVHKFIVIDPTTGIGTEFPTRSSAALDIEGLTFLKPDSLLAGATFLTSVGEGPASLPASYALEQNYPNPFNPETTLRFQLPEASRVQVSIFNLLGKKIRVLTNADYPAGYHTIRWDGRDGKGQVLASGVYFYRIEAGEFVQIRKMSLLR